MTPIVSSCSSHIPPLSECVPAITYRAYATHGRPLEITSPRNDRDSVWDAGTGRHRLYLISTSCLSRSDRLAVPCRSRERAGTARSLPAAVRCSVWVGGLPPEAGNQPTGPPDVALIVLPEPCPEELLLRGRLNENSKER